MRVTVKDAPGRQHQRLLGDRAPWQALKEAAVRVRIVPPLPENSAAAQHDALLAILEQTRPFSTPEPMQVVEHPSKPFGRTDVLAPHGGGVALKPARLFRGLKADPTTYTPQELDRVARETAPKPPRPAVETLADLFAKAS